ncbi:MAG: gliding motility-associated C-terminal domain-containing protein [Owenweeksia sp.]|nr:gliding motility-associated C-terminal domain-containing protein [Owenweeksia sp.]
MNRRSYVDTSLEAYNVDQTPFRYQVQLVQNFDFRKPTDAVRSVLLEDTINNDSTGLILNWTFYDGWPAPSYEAFVAKVDTTQPGGPQWESINGRVDSNYFSTAYEYPELNESTAGTYILKVDATDGFNPGNTYVSESNWVYFELKIDPEDPPVEEPVVPNVFTPNNDDNNDEFFVKAPGFKRANIEVYNRWGTLVHRSSEDVEDGETLFWNGTDINSGGNLADGVYYYVINLEAANAEDSETLQGQVNIFKNK